MNKIAVEGDVRKEKGSFVNGTNDGEARPKRWVAVLVQMNCEKKLLQNSIDLELQIMCQFKMKNINGVIEKKRLNELSFQ